MRVRSPCGRQSSLVALYERPGLRQFLAELSSFADVFLFTAAVPSYAKSIVSCIDPRRRIFREVLYGDSTKATIWQKNAKDLSCLGVDLRRTVLVDNNPFSFLLQPSNGVPCLPYHGDPADDQLLGVILPMLRSLDELPDIRPVLSSRFQLHSWFRSKGLQVAG